MATALYSNAPLADFIVSEASGQRSRDNVLVTQSGAAVPSGSLLKLAAGGTAVFAMRESATGKPTIGVVTVGAAASDGVHTVEFLTATTFKVIGPDAVQVGATGTLGTAFSAGGLGFTLTAGTPAAIAGDKATLDVTAPAFVYEAYTGSGTAAAILYTALPAATGNKAAVAFTGDCEVKRSALVGINAAAEVALAARGIKVRGKAGLPGIKTPAL